MLLNIIYNIFNKKIKNNIFLMLFIFINSASYANENISNYEICDKEYAAGMRIAISELMSLTDPQPRQTIRFPIAREAETYMILLKKYQDLEYKISYFEKRILNRDILIALQKVFQRYNKCKSNLMGYNTADAYNTVTNGQLVKKLSDLILDNKPIAIKTPCEKYFQSDMKKTLEFLKSRLNTKYLLDKAKEYLLLFKQYQDIGYNIQIFELKTFSTDILARLRRPMLYYTRCREAFASKTYSTTLNK